MEEFQNIPAVSNATNTNSQVLADANIINKIQERANTNNKLLNQVDGLTQTLAQGTLTKEQTANLTPDQLRAIQRNDMQSIAQQVGMVKWTMSARGQELQNSLQFFANTQRELREETRMKREDARRNIMEAVNMLGSQAFGGMSDDDKRRIEREAGFETGFLSRARTGLADREAKQEEERQLQLEGARQQMELARRGADLQERQFDFQRQQAGIQNSLARARLSADKATASSESMPPQWQLTAASRSAIRETSQRVSPTVKAFAKHFGNTTSEKFRSTIDTLYIQPLARRNPNVDINVIRNEFFGYLGMKTPELGGDGVQFPGSSEE